VNSDSGEFECRSLPAMEAQPGGFRPQPMGVGALLDSVFGLYRRNFWLFVAVAAVVQVPYQILTTLLSGGAGASSQQLSVVRGGRFGSVHILTFAHWAVPDAGLGLLGLFLFALVALPLELAASTKVVADRYHDRPTSTQLGFRTALGRWLPLLGVGLLLVIIGIGAVVLLGLVNAVLVLALRGVGVLLAVLLWLVAIVVGVMAYLRVAVASSVVVLEPTGPWLAIRRSWELARGSAWRIFGILLILSVLALILAAIGGTAAAIISLLGGGSGQPLGETILLVGRIVITVLISPILSVGLVLLYFDLRARGKSPGPIPVEGQPAFQP
jgi:hypothetical protein